MKRPDTEGGFAVLFVDDEEKALKYFRMAYANEFPVLTAGSVRAALEILERQADEIGVLITDQRMPGQQGVDLLKRAREDWPGIVRILTTAYSDLDDAIEAVNRGEIMRYITKPWDLQALKVELRHALDFFLLRRERDRLVAEKLSVRQGMVQGDRLRGLLAIAAGLERLRYACHGVAAWARDALDKGAAAPASTADLELWGLEVAETLGLMAVHRKLRELEATVEPGYPDQVAVAELLGGTGLPITGQAPPVGARRALLETLIGGLVRLAGQPAQVRLAAVDARGSGPPGAQLVVTGPGMAGGSPGRDVPGAMDEADLLGAYLLAWHHGGSLSRAADGGGTRFELTLPADPAAVVLPAPDADWLAGEFALLEPWE